VLHLFCHFCAPYLLVQQLNSESNPVPVCVCVCVCVRHWTRQGKQQKGSSWCQHGWTSGWMGGWSEGYDTHGPSCGVHQH